MRTALEIAALLIIARWVYKRLHNHTKEIVDQINTPTDPIMTTMSNAWAMENKDQWSN